MKRGNTKRKNWVVTNRRERYLLIIMCIALLAYACFRFVITPEMQERILRLMNEQISVSNATVNAYMPQPETLASIETVMIRSLPPNYPLQDTVTAYRALVDDGQMMEEEAEDADGVLEAREQIPTVTVSMNFSETTYEQLETMLQAIEDLNKAIVVNEMNITTNDTQITGALMLSLYQIPTLEEEEETIFVEPYPATFGKPNPFE